MRYVSYTIVILIVSVGLLIPQSFVLAQSSPMELSSGNIRLRLTPPQPEPNESVTVQAKGSGFRLDTATIAWSVNGQLQTEGVGKKSFTFTAPALGRSTRVTATVLRQNGRVITESVNVQPSQIDLIWEADSHTPPLYKGKEMRAPQGSARVIAFIEAFNQNGQPISNEDIFFRWEFNGRAIAEFSGYGQDTFPSDVSRNENTITLIASTRNDRTIATESITIPNARPQLRFYKKYPLRGTDYSAAVDNTLSLQSSDRVVRAEPYFFDNSDTDINSFSYQWELNSKGIDIGGNEAQLNRQKLGRSVSLSLEVLHPNKRVQRTSQTISVQTSDTNQ